VLRGVRCEVRVFERLFGILTSLLPLCFGADCGLNASNSLLFFSLFFERKKK
jgi:hypothetical protein